MKLLTEKDRIRYARNIAIEDMGEAGQRKLLDAKVLVVGCGALGSVVSTYLVASGVGEVAIADFDTIDISNLQRQVMYRTEDAGLYKSSVLAERLRSLNPDVKVTDLRMVVREKDAMDLFGNYDFIVDGSDNPNTKYMTSGVCENLGLPCSIGGVYEFKGQLTTYLPGTTPYHSIFPPIRTSGILPCSSGGVFGPLPGMIGTMQASEAIKYIAECGELLTDKLFIADLKKMQFMLFAV